MMADAETDTSSRVQFADSISDPKPRMKQQPTQKYDRREIQKRLEIENWMDEQLRDLYDCEVGLGRYSTTASIITRLV